MTDKSIIINNLLNEIDGIYVKLCMNEKNEAMELFKKALPRINDIFDWFFKDIPKITMYEIDVPTEIIIQQLNNMMEAYQYNDGLMLADVLHFELSDTLNYYLEILEAFEKENIIL